ncbi:MAG: PAS domain-containing protein, partial [Deltaproteobacteria bacterium]
MIEKKRDIIYGEGYAPAVYGGKGAYFWGTASPLLDSDANIVGAIESVRDMTAQKKSEEMLLQSKENYRSITDNALNGIYRKTEDGKFLMANPAFLGMLGYTSLEEMTIS